MKNSQLSPKAKMRNKEFQDQNNLKGKKVSFGDFIYFQSDWDFQIFKYILLLIHFPAEYSIFNPISEYLVVYTFINIRGTWLQFRGQFLVLPIFGWSRSCDHKDRSESVHYYYFFLIQHDIPSPSLPPPITTNYNNTCMITPR